MAQEGDGNPKKASFPDPVSKGDVILLDDTGFYHYVVSVIQQKTGVRLDLYESACSESDAYLIAEQAGHH